ncbi:MAG: ribosome maturation factor RimM [Clostridiales bacterium]|nr:ribosome maturation factor RimM [Clostridiales bacterium]
MPRLSALNSNGRIIFVESFWERAREKLFSKRLLSQQKTKKPTNKSADEKIIIGKILKPQGLRGEVKAKISLAGEYLDKLQSVYLEGNLSAVNVKSVSVRGEFAYLRLEGADSCEAAEMFRDKSIAVPRSVLRLKKGEYLHSDLIGCRLLDETGRDYGMVAAIDAYGAADVYTVTGAKTLRFPYLKKLNAQIDPSAKTIAVNAAALSEVAVYEDE